MNLQGIIILETAQCGLPILYINSGGTPEYCKDYGIQFKMSNLEEKLDEMINNYLIYSKKIKDYPFSSERMCSEYFTMFTELKDQSQNFLEKKNNLRTKATNY